MKNINFIVLAVAILALVELGVFASVGLLQNNKPSTVSGQLRQVVSVPDVAPAALSGKWKLIK